jgi:exosortase
MSKVDRSPVSKRPSSAPPIGRKKTRPEKPAAKRVSLPNSEPQAAAPAQAANLHLRLPALLLALAAGTWAYWPTLKLLVEVWNREADYSHGFLVPPLALLFLWFRRASFPGWQAPAYGLGLALLVLSLAARYCGARFYMEFLDGYSIPLWVAAVVALIGGTQVLWWTLPSIGFLFFMIPLPFGLETLLSHPLQRIATQVSVFLLQVFGQPAFADGNVILIGDNTLEVAQACSGLRLFMTMVAVAYAYVMLMRGTWWEKVLLCLMIVPVALLSNALRIVATGLLFQFTTGEVAHQFSHDYAGLAMIPLAGAMFAGFLWYMSKLICEEEVLEMSTLVRDTKV